MLSMQETDVALLEGSVSPIEREASLKKHNVRMDVTLAWKNIRYSIIWERSWDDHTELKSGTTRASAQRKGKRRDKRYCSPNAFSLFRNREAAWKSCICHFWDTRDSVFYNRCFDLCLSDHKQAPYQSHPKAKKWSQRFDMWSSVLIVSKTSASLKSSQRLRHFCLKEIRISNHISGLSSLFQLRT